MSRDPRINPMPWDVIDDDPPLDHLIIDFIRKDGRVGASRYGHAGDTPCICLETDLDHPGGCKCKGCVCTSVNKPWTIEQWRREMADARVVRLSDGPDWFVRLGDNIGHVPFNGMVIVTEEFASRLLPSVQRYFHPSRLANVTPEECLAWGMVLWEQQPDGSW